ncbi:uncharacterized protein LOC134813096 [Bolinopsis microptera]|uniref:uncharacterized protein LOC134813096 n=1 Tax=Bolinopsis microptera TaxID=2820187 RepID=UPI0030799BB0
MSDEFEVNEADSGASKFYPTQASSIKKGGYMLMKGRACKIENINTSKPGKHGSAKCAFTGIDIFTGKKIEAVSPGHANVDAPYVIRKEYPLSYMDESGFLSLFDEETGELVEDIRCPEGDLGERLKTMTDEGKMIIVTILKAMGEEKVIDVKEDTKAD